MSHVQECVLFGGVFFWGGESGGGREGERFTGGLLFFHNLCERKA